MSKHDARVLNDCTELHIVPSWITEITIATDCKKASRNATCFAAILTRSGAARPPRLPTPFRCEGEGWVLP